MADLRERPAARSAGFISDATAGDLDRMAPLLHALPDVYQRFESEVRRDL